MPEVTQLSPGGPVISNKRTAVTLVNTRVLLTEADFETAFEQLRRKLVMRIGQKGWHCYASNHETLGIVGQELREFDDALHERLSKGELNEELLDIAVGSIWGIASNNAGATDW